MPERNRFHKPLAAGLAWLNRRRPPRHSGKLHLHGLTAPVEILRDSLGIPHIYAESTPDALFAQGYVHAQDRLWQMDFTRRLVAGRLSEILGEVALPVDRWMRILGLHRSAERALPLPGAGERELLDAYCAGVNAAIAREPRPLECLLLRYRPEPWTAVDTLSWSKLLAWALSANWEAELLRCELIDLLGPERAAELELESRDSWPLILDAAQARGLGGGQSLTRRYTGAGPGEGAGSNNWVLSGERTTTGMPLLANDMHLALTAPAVWYENHLSAGELDVTGASLPGVPLVIVGHNRRVAWGYTAAFADVQDLYEEHIRRTREGVVEYEYRGEWLPARVSRETIRVRGAKPEVVEVVSTHHGPLINALIAPEAAGTPLALRWTSFEGSQSLLPVYRMNCAASAGELREALRDWTEPVLNVVYADTAGTIGYCLAGKIPLRARGEGCTPVPGWTGEYEWTSSIPVEGIPEFQNPPQGYIATANNRVTGEDYPYYLARDYVYADRAQRIVELIQSRTRHSLEDMGRMQYDQVSPTARDLAGLIGSLEVDPLAEPGLAAAIAMFRSWDGNLHPASPAAAIHEVLVRQLLHLILAGRLGDLADRFAGKGPNPVLAGVSLWGFHAWEWLRKTLHQPDSPWFDLGGGERREDVLLLALRRSLEFLQAELGPDSNAWAWGRLHELTFGHILGRRPPVDALFNRGPYPIGGDGTTIWSTFSGTHDISNDSPSGPPFRFIADLNDLDHCLAMLAPGQSGAPGSRHYDDQIEDWFEGRYHVMLFRREEVERDAESRLELSPALKRNHADA
ncbi:MAG TPA: penicillin acylase family protein [Anaerolineaceae bacterium]|nr:penicillin acylase family protein [Anaerolineaceae bacterium]